MIKFSVYRSGDKVTRLVVKGHAGYAEEGYDIVCAAASTALWMAVKGIEAQGLASVSYEQSDGFVDCRIGAEREPSCDAIINSLLLTAGELAKRYKKNIFLVGAADKTHIREE